MDEDEIGVEVGPTRGRGRMGKEDSGIRRSCERVKEELKGIGKTGTLETLR